MALIYKPKRFKGIEVLSCTDAFEFRPHIHDRYVMWLNSAGGEHYEVAGSSDVLPPGRISVIAPVTVHANRPCEGTSRHLRSFYIEEAFFKDLAAQMGGSPRHDVWFRKESLCDPENWQIFSGLHDLMIADTPDLRCLQPSGLITPPLPFGLFCR